MRAWQDIPAFMKNDTVREYYDRLMQHEKELKMKRALDIAVSGSLIAVLWPVMAGIALLIRLDSRGPAIFRQERVTQYGKRFQIWKFRTMVQNAERMGSQVTISGDARLTRVGRVIRDCRLDELPQLFNVLCGEMTFVGTRPEVVRYVKAYTDEMKATLLLPAGITSRASIFYKDEGKLLENVEDVDKVYTEQVLPEKMQYNLEDLRSYSFLGDLKTMVQTVFAVLK